MSNPSIVTLMTTGPKVKVGNFTIINCAKNHPLTRGKVWIENAAGEGMTFDEAKLSKIIGRLFRTEF
jgi:hypothetical protein